jgi:hypothetical protein
MNDEEELFEHERFILVNRLFMNVGVFLSDWQPVGNHHLLCGSCKNSKYYKYTEIANPTRDDIIKVGSNGWGGRCRCCETLNDAFLEVFRKALDLKSVEDREQTRIKMAEIARLEALARNGDLIAFNEWKKLTGN